MGRCCIKYIRGVLLYIVFCLPLSCAHAVNNFFPTAGGGTLATAPLTLTDGDTFTVNSSIFSNTNSVDNFTVLLAPTSTVTVDPGATINFNGSDISGGTLFFDTAATTISVVNNGTINSLDNAYAISMQNSGAAGAIVTVNNTGTINGDTIITGQNTVTFNLNGDSVINGFIDIPTIGSTVNVGPTTAATLSSATSLPNAELLDVFANSFVYISENSNITNFNVRNGGTVYVNSILTAGTVAGAITNAGTFIVSSDIFKTGTFTNTGIVAFTAQSSVSTSTYDSSAGIHRAVLLDLNNYGKLTLDSSASTDFSAFQVNYGGGYFPNGTLTLVYAPLGIDTAPTSYTVPNQTLFLQFATPTVVGNEIQIALTRTQFQTYGINNTNKEIGLALETIGAASPSNGINEVSPSSSMVNILNAVERSTTVPQLNAALAQLAPMISGPIYNIEMQQQMMDPAEIRLTQSKTTSYIAGDSFCDNTLWLRPFTDQANQNARGATQGYYATSTGVAFGYDRYIYRDFLLGLAVSYAAARVEDKINDNSSTSIKSLQFMLYGTYDFSQYTYFNWILAASTNYYVAQRYVAINNIFKGVTDSSYRNESLAAKLVWGRNYSYGNYLLLTPEASFYGAIAGQYEYYENGSSAANLNVNTPSSTIAQLALSGKATTPFEHNNLVIVPELNASILNNVANGNQTSIAAFAEGGTYISANFDFPRWGYKLGAAITIFNKKHTQIKVNYTHTAYSGYTDNAFYLTAKYVF